MIQELIAKYELQAETNPGLNLEQIEISLAANKGLCWQSALNKKKSEVLAVLNEQILIGWLETNSVPAWQWEGYFIEGEEIKYDESRLINE